MTDYLDALVKRADDYATSPYSGIKFPHSLVKNLVRDLRDALVKAQAEIERLKDECLVQFGKADFAQKRLALAQERAASVPDAQAERADLKAKIEALRDEAAPPMSVTTPCAPRLLANGNFADEEVTKVLSENGPSLRAHHLRPQSRQA